MAQKKRSPKKRKPTPKRDDDRERVRDEQLRSRAGSLWDGVRARYAPEVRGWVDAVAERGLTLSDVLVLEAAEHQRMAQWMDEATRLMQDENSPVGHKTLAALASVQLQSRKHMRTCILAMGPSLTAHDQPVRVPDGLDLNSLLAAQQEFDASPDEILS